MNGTKYDMTSFDFAAIEDRCRRYLSHCLFRLFMLLI